MKIQAVALIYLNWLNRGLGKVGQGGFSGRRTVLKSLVEQISQKINYNDFNIHIRQLKYVGERIMTHLLEICDPCTNLTHS